MAEEDDLFLDPGEAYDGQDMNAETETEEGALALVQLLHEPYLQEGFQEVEDEEEDRDDEAGESPSGKKARRGNSGVRHQWEAAPLQTGLSDAQLATFL